MIDGTFSPFRFRSLRHKIHSRHHLGRYGPSVYHSVLKGLISRNVFKALFTQGLYLSKVLVYDWEAKKIGA